MNPSPPTLSWLPRYRPLLLVAICVCGGVVWDRIAWVPGGIDPLRFWSGLAVLSLVVGVLLSRWDRWHMGAMLLLVSALCVGAIWHHLRWNYFDAGDLGRFAAEIRRPVCLQAIAMSQPRLRLPPTSSPLRWMPERPLYEMVVRVEKIRDGQSWRGAGGYCKLRFAGSREELLTERKSLGGLRQKVWRGVDSEERSLSSAGRPRAEDPRLQFHAGDRLRIYGLLGKQTPALNPGQYDWKLAERGARRNCELYCAASECITVIETKTCRAVERWIDMVRWHCGRWLVCYVGTEQAGLASAVLLGAREGLDGRTTLAFYETGTIHLLVVSGMHVGIVAAVVWSICRLGFLSRRKMVLLTIVIVVGYALLVGARPPVVRATVIVVLWLVAMASGRKPSGLNILSTAALVVLAINPTELFRGGTQLSFLSVAALVAYSGWGAGVRSVDPLERIIRQAAPWHRKVARHLLAGSWRLMVASATVWVIALPLVVYHFHIVTPICVVISPLVWPLVTAGLVAGLGTLVTAWLLPPVAQLLGALTALSLDGLQDVVELARGLSLGHTFSPSPSLWWVCGTYVGLGLLAIVPYLHGARYGRLALAKWTVLVLWIGCGLWLATQRSATNQQLQCSFLAVGHGTCVVLELPGGETVLYDAGAIGSPEGVSRIIASTLWQRGIWRIDAIILSHADVDHYNGVPGILERFSVGTVYTSPGMFGPDRTDGWLTAPDYLRQVIRSHGVPICQVKAGDRLPVADGRVSLEVLHPPVEGVPGSDNANSLVVAVQYEDWQLLLPGDLESTGLQRVTEDPQRDCDILLAPHHGSTQSDQAGFATWCQAEWIVISGLRCDAWMPTGKLPTGRPAGWTHLSLSTNRNRVRSPHPESGVPRFFHTAIDGAVHFVLSDGFIEVRAFRSGMD